MQFRLPTSFFADLWFTDRFLYSGIFEHADPEFDIKLYGRGMCDEALTKILSTFTKIIFIDIFVILCYSHTILWTLEPFPVNFLIFVLKKNVEKILAKVAHIHII